MEPAAPPASDQDRQERVDPGDRHDRDLRDRLLVGAVLAVPVIVLTVVPALQFTYWQWISLTLAAPVVGWGALPFHRAAWRNLRHGAATIDTLVSLGTLAALAWSLYALLWDGAGVPGTRHPFALTTTGDGATDTLPLGAAAGLTTVLLAGRYVAARARRTAGAASGAGTQRGEAAGQRPADRISGVFVPIVIALAVGTLGFRLGSGAGAAVAVTAAVTVLIVACPCAVGLATPTALLVGTRRGAELGVLLAGPEALDAAHRVDTVVLGRTGTLTSGRMRLLEVHTTGREPADDVLRLAAAVENGSEHPLARAVAAAGRERFGALPGVSDFEHRPGLGVQGVVAELAQLPGLPAPVRAATGTSPITPAGGTGRIVAHAVVVGRPALLAEYDIELPAELAEVRERAEAAGRTAVCVSWDGRARGVLVVADSLTPAGAEAVRRLRELGLTPVLLSGDDAATARAVAAEAGIDPADVIAEVLPEDEVAAVRRLRADGRTVAVVGDGRDDAALAAADLGLVRGTGTDVAVGARHLTLGRGDLLTAVDAIRLARRTRGILRGNLFWAFAFTVAALPPAALGLLNPMVVGVTTASSSVFVVLNGLRLRRFRGVHPGHAPREVSVRR
ncbi:heavy metal translocating P-type ATPase [Pseudonocardia sp. RS010]|uniref:heavy metal translocating P-type ATPase n=1 Tax=Pseudonocardia sp. RS010 TaxID=3385979 RepID=UPI0039A0CFCF